MSISVQLPDGSSRELDAGATAADLAADIGPGLAKAALIATINGEQADLDVELTDGYEGVWFQVEDDADGVCGSAKKIKGDPDADLDFACNKNGTGNLVTSRIDDDTSPDDGPLDFSNSADNADLDVIEGGADPRYAVVHADIFIPGSCAVDVGPCNHDSDDGTTPEQSCYDSGFGGGTSPEGYYGTAEASCENAFDSTGEGMFAEANEGGGTFSSNRPKDGDTAHMNWAMYVQLEATCQGTVAVLADASAPTCDSAAITRTAVADGGD